MKTTLRDIFICWVGPGVGIIEKGKKTAFLGDAQSFLQVSTPHLSSFIHTFYTHSSLSTITRNLPSPHPPLSTNNHNLPSSNHPSSPSMRTSLYSTEPTSALSLSLIALTLSLDPTSSIRLRGYFLDSVPGFLAVCWSLIWAVFCSLY